MATFASSIEMFNVAKPLSVLDLDGAPEKVKTLQILSHAQGIVWKVRGEAASSTVKSRQFAGALWALSLASYKDSLLANPRDQRTLRNVAEVYHALDLLPLAGVFAQLALETNGNDPVSLYKFALFLYQTTKKPDQARPYFERAVACNPTTPGALLAYSDFALQTNDLKKAEELITMCLDRYPNHADGSHKMAHFSQHHSKDYDKAHKYYKRAIEIEGEDVTLIRHYVEFLRDNIDDITLSATYELLLKKLDQQSTISGRGSKLWHTKKGALVSHKPE